MTDIAKIIVQAGMGGSGLISFRREKYVPKGGPDGGRGGNGGSIIIRGTKKVATLQDFAGKDEFIAESGQPGGARKMIGKAGASTVLFVPLGTRIWIIAENNGAFRRRQSIGINQLFKPADVHRVMYERDKDGAVAPERPTDELWKFSTGEIIPDEIVAEMKEMSADALLKKYGEQLHSYEITEEGQEIVVAQGGFFGRGNESFKGPERTTPFIAEYGTPGERRVLLLELRLLADVGLVGLPNAGKSTLLSIVTNARPKIAAYPFTTLEPNLGIMALTADGKQEIVLADIPGLIEGASQGKGLGHSFLRHIEHCSTLLYVLSLDETTLYEVGNTPEVLAEALWKQYLSLKKELEQHSAELKDKKSLVSINKIDIFPDGVIAATTERFAKENVTLYPFSGITGIGLDQLKTAIRHITAPEDLPKE